MKFTNKNNFSLEEFKITPEEFFERKTETPPPMVLDIRPTEAFEKHHIVGAKKLPAEFIEENLMQLPPFGMILVYSDAKDADIETSIKLLFDNQFTDLLYVEGGYEALIASSIEVTAAAKKEIGQNGNYGVRLAVVDGEMRIEKVDEENADDSIFSVESIPIHAPTDSIRFLHKSVIDFQEGTLLADNPGLHGNIEEKIQNILDEQINPSVAMHGGGINLLEVKEDKVYIEMTGGCQGCGMSSVTLKQGIEVVIKDSLPQITEILDTTDHQGGMNPYYQPSEK